MTWRLGIYDMDKFWNNQYDEMKLIATTEIEPEFGNVLLIDDKTYRTCASSPDNKYMGLEEIAYVEEPEDETEEHFTCPYCKRIDHDAVELSDDNGTTECGYCGSEIEYERDYTITYNTYPVKRNDPIKL